MAHPTPEEKLLELIKKAQGKMRLKKELKVFTKVSMVLIALIVVILIVFLIDLFSTGRKASEVSVEAPKRETLEMTRDMGVVGYKADKAKEEIIEKTSLPSKEELAKDLNLLGIIAGDDKQAIIEDKKTKKTFFLYKGDSVGEFRVYDVRENAVILDCRGERIELSM